MITGPRKRPYFYGDYMDYIKTFRAAGEPTIAAPIYLCEEARESLANWLHYDSAEQMHKELKQEIEENDRFEFIAVDNNGKHRAMMIIYAHYDPHWGKHIFTRFAFSKEPGALTEGYKWIREIAKSLNVNGYLITRQVAANKILSTFKELAR